MGADRSSRTLLIFWFSDFTPFLPIVAVHSPTSFFTVDVEDYFQVTAFDGVVQRSEWEHLPSRVDTSTRRMLELLAERGVRGTFFVLGWVAERFPHLVRAIAAAGHEVGSHSYWHRLVYQQTPQEFRADLRQSKQVLEDVLGTAVTAYRAPTFSIIDRSRWALEILVQEGFTLDSSLFPIRGHDRYGLPGIEPGPHRIDTPAGPLWEVPLSAVRCFGLDLPASGGGYFRFYPYWLSQRLIRRVHAAGLPLNFYIHPWEIDPDQPRSAHLGAKSRFRHYVNLRRTAGRLRRLLAEHAFSVLGDSLSRPLDPAVKVPCVGANRS